MGDQPKVFAVIVAAGSGKRLRGPRPKQFLPLAGEPLFAHALRAAEAAGSVSRIVLVLPAADIEEGRRIVASLDPAIRKLAAIVPGGAERQDSVRAGAEAAGRCDVVLVHDAARPFATPALFDAVAAGAIAHGAAVAAVPVADTVKETDGAGTIGRTMDRSRLLLSQTPQGFRRDLLMQALDMARETGLVATDEAALVERLGRPVHAVPGSRGNMKITHEEDLEMARVLARRRGQETADDTGLRVGLGEDLHPLAEGRDLVLGGVKIPFDRGLSGHSDGDALVHALVDAVCGAALLPSIGELFPDTDMAWRDASSLGMLARVSALAGERGWILGNADCVVLCDAPKIAPHVGAMREAIAAAMGVTPDRISIKGKSAEGLGVEGRGEGISTRAIVLMRRAEESG